MVCDTMENSMAYPYGKNPQDKTEGQQLLEAAVVGLALGVTIGAIIYYLGKKE
jgi:hypothetical protein